MSSYYNPELCPAVPFPDSRDREGAFNNSFTTYFGKPHYVSNFNKLTLVHEGHNINCLEAGYVSSLGEPLESCDTDLLGMQITEELNYEIMKAIYDNPKVAW